MTTKCAECKNLRDEIHFRPSMSACIFCELDLMYLEVGKLERYLNSHPPMGQPLQEPCGQCRTLNYWVNLVPRETPHGMKKYCHACNEQLTREVTEQTVTEAQFDALMGTLDTALENAQE